MKDMNAFQVGLALWRTNREPTNANCARLLGNKFNLALFHNLLPSRVMHLINATIGIRRADTTTKALFTRSQDLVTRCSNKCRVPTLNWLRSTLVLSRCYSKDEFGNISMGFH